MATYSREYNSVIEALISIFKAEKGDLKVLLLRRGKDPYKGYWALPFTSVNNDTTLEDAITDCVNNDTGIHNLYIKQCYTLSKIDRNPDARVFGVSYFGLVDSVTLLLKQDKIDGVEMKWFSINDLPKLAFDHDEVVRKCIESLSREIVNVNVMKNLFPSDFTLPELQKIYEQVLNIKIDRRNFRKKFLSQDIIEDTNEYNDGANGRPAKLYRFREKLENINIY